MNIMENKRVTAIAVLMAAGFGALCYKGYENYSALKATQSEIAAKIDKVEGYRSEELPPTAKNSQLVVQAANEVEKLAAELTKDVEKYAIFCVKNKEGKDAQNNVTPVSFQNRLRALSSQIVQDAGGHCVLHNSSGDFGMTSLKNQAPTELAAPYYNFLLTAVNGALHHIIAAGAPTIERVYCAPLPEEEMTARKQAAYFPLSFEVAFTAKRSEVIKADDPSTYSVLPQVLNKLAQDPNVFYIVTGMAVSAIQNAPVVSGSSAAVSPAEASAETPQTTRKASLLLGSPDEQVNVHLNIQALYFTTDKL